MRAREISVLANNSTFYMVCSLSENVYVRKKKKLSTVY